MEQSVLELPQEQKNEILKELKAQYPPQSKYDMITGSLCSLFWLSPVGYLVNIDKHKECWNILYLKD